MGKPALLGGVNFTESEAKKLKSLAKKGVGIDKRTDGHKKKIAALDESIRDLNEQINDWKRSCQTVSQERDIYKHNYDRLWAEVKPFINAIRSAPQRLLAFIRDNLQQQNHNREGITIMDCQTDNAAPIAPLWAVGVPDKPLEWFYPNVFVRGKLNGVQGMPCDGETWLMCEL